MNSKIKLIALGTVTIILAGCGNSVPKLTYDETYKTFIAQSTSTIKMMNELTMNPTMENGNFELGIKSKSMNAKLELDTNGKTDSKNIKADGDVQIDINYKEKEQKLDLKGEVDIDYTMDKEQLYLKLNAFDAKSSTGPLTMQIDMAKAFSQSLINKRIKLPLTPEGAQEGITAMKLEEVYAFQNRILNVAEQSLNEYPLFEAGEKTVINGKDAYFVTLNKENIIKIIKKISEDKDLQKFMGEEDVRFGAEEEKSFRETLNKMVFSGALVIYEKDRIGLEILEIKRNTEDSGVLKGSFGGPKGNIMFTDSVEKSEFTINRTESTRGGNSYEAQATQESKKIFDIKGSSSYSLSKSALNFDIDGQGQITVEDDPTMQGPLEFSFDLSSAKKTTKSFEITVPKDAVSIQELMGATMGTMPMEQDMSEDAMMQMQTTDQVPIK